MSEAEDIEGVEDADLTPAQLREQLTEARQDAAAARVQLRQVQQLAEVTERYKVVSLEHRGLPVELAGRVEGTTPAEIDADIDVLAEALGVTR